MAQTKKRRDMFSSVLLCVDGVDRSKTREQGMKKEGGRGEDQGERERMRYSRRNRGGNG